jgi:hypothetical protein
MIASVEETSISFANSVNRTSAKCVAGDVDTSNEPKVNNISLNFFEYYSSPKPGTTKSRDTAVIIERVFI